MLMLLQDLLRMLLHTAPEQGGDAVGLQAGSHFSTSTGYGQLLAVLDEVASQEIDLSLASPPSNQQLNEPQVNSHSLFRLFSVLPLLSDPTMSLPFATTRLLGSCRGCCLPAMAFSWATACPSATWTCTRLRGPLASPGSWLRGLQEVVLGGLRRIRMPRLQAGPA